MRYKFLFLCLLCLLSAGIAFVFSPYVRGLVFGITDRIEIAYQNSIDNFKQRYDRYFDQAKSIARYQEQDDETQKLKLELSQARSQIQAMLNFYPQMDLFKNASFEPALIISYVRMAEYNRVWLNTKAKLSEDKIYGIVHDGYALGIASFKSDRLMGIFNGDENCSYSVFIGKDKIPALIRYNPNDRHKILADFIPQYLNVHVGDEVYTSGLDSIFVENIPVGKVEEIIDENGYVTAIVTPYANRKFQRYLWIINRED